MNKQEAMQIAYEFLNEGPEAEMHHQLGYEYFIREKPTIESRKFWVFAYGGRTISDHEEEQLSGGYQGVAVDKQTGTVDHVLEQGFSSRTAFLLYVSRREYSPLRWILARGFMLWEIIRTISGDIP